MTHNLTRRSGIRAKEHLPVAFSCTDPDFKKRSVLTGQTVNIMTMATHAACKLITSITKPEKYYFQSNFSNIKKVSANHFSAGNGKMVIVEAFKKYRKRTLSTLKAATSTSALRDKSMVLDSLF